MTLPPIAQVSAGWTFGALTLGLAGGLLLAFAQPDALPMVLAVSEPVGDLWLRALQATIVPLVAALLFTGIVQTVATASAGAMARRSLGYFLVFLGFSAAMALFVTPALLALLPIPGSAGEALRGSLGGTGAGGPVPGMADYLRSIVPTNVLDAAANDRMLPMILFMSVFALASTRLEPRQRELLATFFAAIAAAMLVVIGWVLAVAPLGVLALSLTVAAKSGAAAIGALAHYVLIVVLTGAVVWLSGYAFAVLIARKPPAAFARAMVPVQVFALSTQSSLASLPAMLGACRKLGVRETTAEFVMPLAVSLFRATSPAMNLAVVVYVAHWYGVPLGPGALVSGWIMAILVSLSSVSLPGTISYVASVGPIAIAMGVPVGPLALLVAVEVLPDLMRTLGNVTLDVAVTAAVDRGVPGGSSDEAHD
ncbi:dicarboxylate/amino acid:cation symporter [Novosphingobium sp. KCTC 2891]|uniref:dicarboxylate/amino acid:cation symporter n=1 Tax=Novosphingobium sp. KCTC 2891 TaxID=2989730 RepID=UPI002222C223|nr:dicarboxylate/amino acid:cation symporter [Novosphingobium sp. KCTC 2891]MCW1381959.1 dicarboxylate/amino acid:cation symporter [Novosphingobium sp. KCTC 2891]